jgi:6-phosphogluconolactonase
VDRTGKSLVVANYGNGVVAVFRVGADRRLSESTAQVQHNGSGPDRSQQGGPHPHAVVLSPDNRFVFVPDLGLDKVFAYRLDPAQATGRKRFGPGSRTIVAPAEPGSGRPRRCSDRGKAKSIASR